MPKRNRAALAAVLLATAWLLGPGASADSVAGGQATPNPSTRPDISLCDSLAPDVGGNAALVRAVTVSRGALAGWLGARSEPARTLAAHGLSADVAATTLCVYAHSGASDPHQPGALVLAQGGDGFAEFESGDVSDLARELDPLQDAIRDRIDSRPTIGPDLPPWREPCGLGGVQTTIAALGSQGVPARLPDSVLANDANLVGAWMCGGDVPELMYPTVKVFFEAGWDRDDYPSIWEHGLLQDQSGWMATVFGTPTLVLHPVDGTLGEVMYIEDGVLMRVLGDGSVPAEQLLEVVESSHRLG